MGLSYELAKALDMLAERFGTDIEHLYSVLMKQVYLQMWGNVIALLALGGLFGVWYYIKNRVLEEENDDRYSSKTQWYEMDGLVGSFILLMLLIVAAAPFLVYNIISILITPEYHVLKLIMDMVTGGGV